jgi:hypothetical protein
MVSASAVVVTTNSPQIGQWGPDTQPLAEEIRAVVPEDEFRVHATLASPSLGDAIREAIMTSQNPGQAADARQEHFDNPELGSGARAPGTTLPNPAERAVPSGP